MSMQKVNLHGFKDIDNGNWHFLCVSPIFKLYLVSILSTNEFDMFVYSWLISEPNAVLSFIVLYHSSSNSITMGEVTCSGLNPLARMVTDMPKLEINPCVILLFLHLSLCHTLVFNSVIWWNTWHITVKYQ